MKTVTINGQEYWAGSARVEPDVATLSGSLVEMKLTTCMGVIMKRFTDPREASAYADALNALPVNV